MKPNAPAAEKLAAFHSSLQRANPFTAENVSQNTTQGHKRPQVEIPPVSTVDRRGHDEEIMAEQEKKMNTVSSKSSRMHPNRKGKCIAC